MHDACILFYHQSRAMIHKAPTQTHENPVSSITRPKHT
jgi:hypothetical protein